MSAEPSTEAEPEITAMNKCAPMLAGRLRKPVAAYGMMLTVVAGAIGVRLLLNPFLSDRLPFITMFAAVVVTARYCGKGPALLSLVVGSLAVAYFVLEPRYSLAVNQLEYQTGCVLFALIGLGSISAFDTLEKARQRTEERKQQLEQEVAARRAAEKFLANREELLRITFASIGDAVITTDAKGNVTYLNAVAQTLTGWTQEEACGKPLPTVFNIVNEETRLPVENPAQKVLMLRLAIGLANHTVLISKDKTERPIDDSAAPIQDDQGRVMGVVLVFRDISDRRRAEIAMREADRRKDEFLATLAHELRNPLAPIRNSLELMKRLKGNAELIEQARSIMERQTGQMVRLIDDLLDVGRITLNKLELRRERVELASVVDHCVEAIHPLCEQSNHELNVTLPPDPIYLHADPVRLAQVFGNLLTNACKYTEPGGRIWLTAEQQGSDVFVKVQDTGVGIPPDMLSKVFDMFTQVDRSEGGLGIGLSLVKRLVEMHEGTVTAHSAGPGQGSEFVVRLPILIERPKSLPPPKPTLEEFPKKPHRILIVDDNKDAAKTLAILLNLEVKETHIAHDGLEGIEKAATYRPDVILLDVGLPKMNGYGVCRSIREQPWGKDILIVALTGWGQDEDRQKSEDAGFNCHLVKPVEFTELMKLLADLTPV